LSRDKVGFVVAKFAICHILAANLDEALFIRPLTACLKASLDRIVPDYLKAFQPSTLFAHSIFFYLL